MNDRRTEVVGRLVLEDVVVPGRIVVEDGWIGAIHADRDEAGAAGSSAVASDLPLIAPGFVDVHVHGWGGHDAMADDAASLDGMARALLRHGVTSFLPTAVTAALPTLRAFAERVRRWIPLAPDDGARPLGFNLEGPFLAPERRGAHDARHLKAPAEVSRSELEPMLDGLRLITVAPELPGARELISWLDTHGVRISMGHSAADLTAARAGYAAGGASTTHLFNAMTGIDHRAPGLALAALTEDAAYVELIADGHHVHPAIWPLIARAKPGGRLMLVSDAISLAGVGDGRAIVGGLEIEVIGTRSTLVGTDTLAGSVIALDTAVRNLVAAGIPLPAAIAAATRNPLALLGVTDRGRIAVGQRADLIELDDDFRVRRVLRDGRWLG